MTDTALCLDCHRPCYAPGETPSPHGRRRIRCAACSYQRQLARVRDWNHAHLEQRRQHARAYRARARQSINNLSTPSS